MKKVKLAIEIETELITSLLVFGVAMADKTGSSDTGEVDKVREAISSLEGKELTLDVDKLAEGESKVSDLKFALAALALSQIATNLE